jgi:hypothetical protein
MSALAGASPGSRAFVGADHDSPGVQQPALPPAPGEVQHRARPLQKVGVGREHPRAVLPGLERVFVEPARDRRGRCLGHAALDHEAVELRPAEARERDALAARQVAGDRLDLGDLLRGKTAWATRPRSLRGRPVPPPGSVLQSPTRSADMSTRFAISVFASPPPPTARSAPAPPFGREASGSPLGARAPDDTRHRVRSWRGGAARHNVVNPSRPPCHEAAGTCGRRRLRRSSAARARRASSPPGAGPRFRPPLALACARRRR